MLFIKFKMYENPYNLKDFHQNPNGCHQKIVVAKLLGGKLFSGSMDLPNVVYNNIKQRNPKSIE